MPERRCNECVHFIEIHKQRWGGGLKCPSDTTEGRKTVHARDYACDAFVEAEEGAM
jgi:hypothetical protein